MVESWFPHIPSQLFESSLLVGGLAKMLIPAQTLAENMISVHPLAVIGYSGLLINALNLLPIGRLDGGRIVQAIFGRITAGTISGIALVLQGLSALLGNSPLLLWWGVAAIFLQREADVPCQEELTEPNNVRSAIGLLLLVIMLATLIPFPDGIPNVSEVLGNKV
eukprot:Plantae.Rhodophyta-Rhodochaete_pulchella.ctg8381.p1 GENE.Plantae.Rhodophyta-Rhodochaete_pulchella.ctg8381~~Plantae.Rhodophyta-Rhodochaete_pulchella.ctg8381.p1  ORF type:complete len:165 (+),score=17.57 Plantae.Rhodophyta-Rhodochaete_pulchella.ctg8381:204-698(+)